MPRKPLRWSILNEQVRWEEIRFHHFCMGLYDVRQNLMDVCDVVEGICLVAHIDGTTGRNLTVRALTDHHYKPTTQETLSLARKAGYSLSESAALLKVSRRNIAYQVKALEEAGGLASFPRHPADDQLAITAILKIVDIMKRSIL